MLGEALSIINKFIPDKGKANKLKAEVEIVFQNTLSDAVKADTRVRLAELKSTGLSSIWRPLAAIMTFSCLFLYWFIYPSLQIMVALFDLNIYLPELRDLPIEFYGLSGIFVSIYAYGRSMEKRGL
jgi:hypothetical protein